MLREKITAILEMIPDSKLERVYRFVKYIYIHG